MLWLSSIFAAGAERPRAHLDNPAFSSVYNDLARLLTGRSAKPPPKPWTTCKGDRPPCGAETRKGHPCRAVAVWDYEDDRPVNGRCRMHGVDRAQDRRREAAAAGEPEAEPGEAGGAAGVGGAVGYRDRVRMDAQGLFVVRRAVLEREHTAHPIKAGEQFWGVP